MALNMPKQTIIYRLILFLNFHKYASFVCLYRVVKVKDSICFYL